MYQAERGIQEEIRPEICEGVDSVGVSIIGGPANRRCGLPETLVRTFGTQMNDGDLGG